MKKRNLFILVILILVPITTFANGPQWDITVNVPYYIGIRTEDMGSEGATLDKAFVFPDVKFNYYFGSDIFKVGIGVRAFTLILVNLAYPIVSVESQLGPIVINANLGGGVFALFGLVSEFGFEQIFIPEISVAFDLGSGFRIGTGATAIMAPELAGFGDFVYVGSVFVRWSI